MNRGKLVVVGQGYTGIAIAVRAAESGWRVTGYDSDCMLVTRLQRGLSPSPDVERASLQCVLANGTYTATSALEDCGGFDFAVIAVPTPLRDGAPDLSHIEGAARDLAKYITPRCTVILESTTVPGTTEDLLVPTLEHGSGLRVGFDFHVGYSPERIDPGNSVWRFENIPKIVAGIDDGSTEQVDSFYRTLVQQTIVLDSTREAEFTKLVENTFRQVNIALVNELSVLARRLGLNIWKSLDAASTKPFGFMRFTPGPGVGGHCIPIDPTYLAWHVRSNLGSTSRFADLAAEVNGSMPEYVVQRCVENLAADGHLIHDSRVLLLGLAYKADVGDLRESPALKVAGLLREAGADVRACEPFLAAGQQLDDLKLVNLTDAALRESDLVVVLTDHTDFDSRLIVECADRILDTRNFLPDAVNVERL